MPYFSSSRMSDTFDLLTTKTSQQYTDCLKKVYEGLSSNARKQIADGLSIGSTMDKTDKPARRNERLRRLLAALLTEANFGRFGLAMMQLSREHSKARDHWEIERIMTRTYYSLQMETGRNNVSRNVFETWAGGREMYANSCGGFASMLKEILPKNHDENKWVAVCNGRNLTPDQAIGHLDAISNPNWSYCYVSLGCHAWVFERASATTARNVQVWSNMNVEDSGFNYAYSLDHGWGLKVHTIAEYKQAMINLIRETDERRATRTIIADPLCLWGVDPFARAQSAGRVVLRLDTLPANEVIVDLKASINWQVARQLHDYQQNGLNLADVR